MRLVTAKDVRERLLARQRQIEFEHHMDREALTEMRALGVWEVVKADFEISLCGVVLTRTQNATMIVPISGRDVMFNVGAVHERGSFLVHPVMREIASWLREHEYEYELWSCTERRCDPDALIRFDGLTAATHFTLTFSDIVRELPRHGVARTPISAIGRR
ncbi:MAG: hypothetical protein JHD15_00710 [Phenylobacterium sp.]|uniref:hypothetical protein n=1 Tax=Phenylobacterium sp. TaxID=1871053 RepID=UPI001A350FC6|nr:hypothetical protein [Phenylobacterium sp.]MBJ7408877.1 hypothetical protein [Phenylobacterium sp.]